MLAFVIQCLTDQFLSGGDCQCGDLSTQIAEQTITLNGDLSQGRFTGFGQFGFTTCFDLAVGRFSFICGFADHLGSFGLCFCDDGGCVFFGVFAGFGSYTGIFKTFFNGLMALLHHIHKGLVDPGT
ncbi:hypothetical protein SDC9_111299 [bioreactor metagenome]|uniref:Uncharacterized protein n=1 Tax=bioreactor metagenome TaxID=1076179 RepID=A0A645BMA6_9ZZZZ